MHINSISKEKPRQSYFSPANFLRITATVIVSPGKFFEHDYMGQGYVPPIFFLLIFSSVSCTLSSLMFFKTKAFFSMIHFINLMIMPFITAFILYIITKLFLREKVRYQRLFAISAFANVTLLFSWIPGIVWVTGLWHYYLIGLGISKAEKISTAKVCLAILITVALLLALIRLVQSTLLL